MNERIKQLVRHADFVLYEDGNFRVYDGQFINDELEKFAELVIKKCAEVGSYYGGNVKHLILEHFRVAE